MVVVRPSPPEVVPSRPVTRMAAAAVEVMAAILMPMVEARSEVTLVIPPAPTVVKEREEIGLPASPGGGTHGSPSWSELSGSGGDLARLDVEQPSAGHKVEEVEIPCPREVGTRVKPPAIPPS